MSGPKSGLTLCFPVSFARVLILKRLSFSSGLKGPADRRFLVRKEDLLFAKLVVKIFFNNPY